MSCFYPPGASVSRSRVFSILDQDRQRCIQQGDLGGADTLASGIRALRSVRGETLDAMRHQADLQSHRNDDKDDVLAESLERAMGVMVGVPIYGAIFGALLPFAGAVAATCGVLFGVPLALAALGNHRQAAEKRADRSGGVAGRPPGRTDRGLVLVEPVVRREEALQQRAAITGVRHEETGLPHHAEVGRG